MIIAKIEIDRRANVCRKHWWKLTDLNNAQSLIVGEARLRGGNDISQCFSNALSSLRAQDVRNYRKSRRMLACCSFVNWRLAERRG